MNCFDTEPASKMVSGLIGIRLSRSAIPCAPCQSASPCSPTAGRAVWVTRLVKWSGQSALRQALAGLPLAYVCARKTWPRLGRLTASGEA